MTNETMKRCNFCGKSENKVKNMFSAGDSHICDECVMFCYDILEERVRGAPGARAFSRIKKDKAVGNVGDHSKKTS